MLQSDRASFRVDTEFRAVQAFPKPASPMRANGKNADVQNNAKRVVNIRERVAELKAEEGAKAEST